MEIGLDPIRWGAGDYWLFLDKFNEWDELSWYWLNRFLELMEFCYARGYIQEFQAKLYYSSSRMARIRLYFYRKPDLAVA